VTPMKFRSILERQGVVYDESVVFDAPIRGLLGSNPKLEKSRKGGYATAGLMLSPSTRSGLQTCASASDRCRAVCLNEAGHGGIYKRGEHDNAHQAARRRKTHWFFARRAEFMTQLDIELRAHVKKSLRQGFQPCARLNTLSDIRWESVLDDDGLTVFDRHEDIIFYDYTKHPNRDFSDYHLTFSLSESNDSDARAALERGQNVAVVFHDVPDTFWGFPVIDGDESDLRFLDPEGVVVGLKAKGPAKQDKSGFVR